MPFSCSGWMLAIQPTIPVVAGQPITVTLAWRALSTPSRDLVRFLHVLGPDGRPVAQEDSQPCAGACPAPSWLPGEVLVDQARLDDPGRSARRNLSARGRLV